MAKLRFHIRYPEEKIPDPILYEIGKEYQVIPSIRRADVRETTGWMDVEFTGDADEIDRGWLAGKQTIGVTAGASAPEVLVDQVIQRLREWGAETVNESQGRSETITFSLPKELKAQ